VGELFTIVHESQNAIEFNLSIALPANLTVRFRLPVDSRRALGNTQVNA
jgi:hypothetical protein